MKKSFLIFIKIIVVLLLSNIYISDSIAYAQDIDSNAGLVVIIDSYSGRPNPYFIVAKTDTDVIDVIKNSIITSETLDSKYKDSGVFPIRKTAYRGIIIENIGNIADIPERVEIYDNNILLTSIKNSVVSGKTLARESTNNSIEAYILNLAVQKGVISADGVEDIKWLKKLKKEGSRYTPRPK